MGYGTWKVHHGIMKSTAMQDYNVVKKYLEESGQGCLVELPKGKHWHKIEDATIGMLTKITNAEIIFENGLYRGFDYYISIQS